MDAGRSPLGTSGGVIIERLRTEVHRTVVLSGRLLGTRADVTNQLPNDEISVVTFLAF